MAWLFNFKENNNKENLSRTSSLKAENGANFYNNDNENSKIENMIDVTANSQVNKVKNCDDNSIEINSSQKHDANSFDIKIQFLVSFIFFYLISI